MLTLIDEHSRECLAIDVARKLTSEDVLERLSDGLGPVLAESIVDGLPSEEWTMHIAIQSMKRCCGSTIGSTS